MKPNTQIIDSVRTEAKPIDNLLNKNNEIIGIEYMWNTGELQIRWVGKKCALKSLRRVSCAPAENTYNGGR